MEDQELTAIIFKKENSRHNGFGTAGLAGDAQAMANMSQEEKETLIQELDDTLRYHLSAEEYNAVIKEIYDTFKRAHLE